MTWKEIYAMVCKDCSIDHMDVELAGHHCRGFHPVTGELLVDWHSRQGFLTLYYK